MFGALRVDRFAAVAHFRLWQILLQKSKLAGQRIFRQIVKRKVIADSCGLTPISEVAGEFNVGR